MTAMQHDINELSISILTQFFPLFTISAAAQIVLAAIDSHRTAFTELKIVAMCAFYYITALFASDFIGDNLFH